MDNVEIIRTPGFYYDLSFVFSIYFNQEDVNHKFSIRRDMETQQRYFQAIMERFSPIPNELYLFFYVPPKKSSLFCCRYFIEKRGEFGQGFCLQTMLDALQDEKEVVKSVLLYYFPDLSPEEVERCQQSVVAASELVRMSTYNDEMKASLYQFFICPAAIINLLCEELKAKEKMLENYYKEREQQLLEAEENLDADWIAEQFASFKGLAFDFRFFRKLYISFCLINKGIIWLQWKGRTGYLILGVDYLESFRSHSEEEAVSDIQTFGMALADENRLKVLRFIAEKRFATLKDIEQSLDLTATNAYHHISTLIKANMLNTQTKKDKTVIYSINTMYFRSIRKILHDFCK